MDSLSDDFDLDISLDSLNIIGMIIIALFVCCVIYYVYHLFSTYDTNNTKSLAVDNNKNIIQLLEHYAQSYPDQSALVVKNKKDDWIPINYEDYYYNIIQFAESMVHFAGIKSTTLIIGSNSPAWIYSYLGTIACKGIPVTISPEYFTENDCQQIMKDNSPDVIVIEDGNILKLLGKIPKTVKLILYYSPLDANTVELIKHMDIPVISFGVFMAQSNVHNKQSKQNKKLVEKQIKSIKNTDIISVIYTHQNNQRICLTHKNINSVIKSFIATFKNRDVHFDYGNERFVSYLPLSSIIAQVFYIYLPIYLRSCVWFTDSIDNTLELVNCLITAKPTIFVTVPYTLKKIKKKMDNDASIASTITPNFIKKLVTKSDKVGLDECKFCFVTGEQIDRNLYDELINDGIELYEMYALSEASGPVAVSLPQYRRTNSVGIPLDSLRVKISVDGCIHIKGDSVFDNNLDRGWYNTGDHGKLDNGYLFIKNKRYNYDDEFGTIPNVEYAFVIDSELLLFPKSNKTELIEELKNNTDNINEIIKKLNSKYKLNIEKFTIIESKFDFYTPIRTLDIVKIKNLCDDINKTNELIQQQNKKDKSKKSKKIKKVKKVKKDR